MCGICGIVSSEKLPDAEAALRRMLPALRHRGPDEEGLLVAPNAALGVRRLSIIDLAGGHQPVWNETHTVAAICNGEIYNFNLLREELSYRGHHFATRCDTEVLVHGWEVWGAELVHHLRGMFAFAVAELPDGPEGRICHLFLARDRLGIKPLYYAALPRGIIFCSEVRALLASECLSPRLSQSALESFLLFGAVGEPETLAAGILSVPPGHCVEIDLRRPLVELLPRRWWDSPDLSSPAPATIHGPSRESLPHELRAHLEDSMREHLISDVPLGVFLSGGLDSTALAALASRQQPGIRTFTVSFAEKEFSEAKTARRAAACLGTEHSEKLVTGEEMVARLDDAIASMDQPTMDGINTWFVSEAARASGLKVALSGLGSDELFGGYPTFRATSQLARLQKMGGWLPRGFKSALAFVAGMFPVPGTQRDARRKALSAWSNPQRLPHPYFFSRLLFEPGQASALQTAPAKEFQDSPWRAWITSAAQSVSGASSSRQVSWLELRSYMLNVLLRDTDAMSMHHSLEVRVPFLDHRVVQFALQSTRGEGQSSSSKILLIKALQDILPEEVLARPKRPFVLPWEQWLRGPLRQRIAGGLANPAPSLAAAMDFAAVGSVWQDFLRGRTSWSRPWSLFVLNEWARRHLPRTG
jgi:asparagine synthase (glutamine-hydrolysing)